MNGLLHRVAARAAGTAVAVRSDVGLAYAGGGSALGEVDEARGGEAQARLPSAAEPLARMPSSSATPEHQRTMPTVAAAGPAVLFDAVRTPPALVDAGIDAAPALGTSVIAPNARVEPGAGAMRHWAFDEPQAAMPPQAATMPPQSTATRPVPGLAPAATGPWMAPAMRGIATPALTASPPDAPAPLMPREAHAPIPLAPVPQAAARRGALPQGGAASQGEADTEVHIHIGRIDVTAVRETPAPRRRASAAPAPMSLDGYLAKRGSP